MEFLLYEQPSLYNLDKTKWNTSNAKFKKTFNFVKIYFNCWWKYMFKDKTVNVLELS